MSGRWGACRACGTPYWMPILGSRKCASDGCDGEIARLTGEQLAVVEAVYALDGGLAVQALRLLPVDPPRDPP